MLRNHGILPAAGGYLDQPADIMADIRMLTVLFNDEFAAAQQQTHRGEFNDIDKEFPAMF